MPDLNNIDTSNQTNEETASSSSSQAISLVDQIETHFQSLKETLESRKNDLLDELKNSNSDLNKLELSFGELDLNKLIKTYGKLQLKDEDELKKKTNDFPIKSVAQSQNQVECFLSGKGLRECNVNKTARFTLTFKNRALSKSNVSFLDIFIVATESNKKSPISSNNKKNESVRLRKLSASGDTQSQCNCDCRLEFIADGLYAVNYKLDKPGVYLLNVLVNKIHVGESPYKLFCYEVKTIKPSKTMGSFNLSPASSTIFPSSARSTFQSSLRHSITNENMKKNMSDLHLQRSKSIKTNSLTHLSNISNLTNVTKKTATQTSPSSSPSSSLKSKISKQNCFSFTNGVTSKSSHSINSKDSSSILNSRVGSPLQCETKTSLVSSHSNFEFSTMDNRKDDDCLFLIGSRGIIRYEITGWS